MEINYNGIGTPTPQAHVTRSKSKSRGKLKIYNNNSVYLEEGEEFEIELFNPTQKTVLAKIEFNGEMISHSGLVLKQGQRVFLERFFDDNRKFKFEVYDIENTQKTRIKADLAKSNATSKNSEISTREKLNEFLEGQALLDNINEINKLKEDAVNFETLEDELSLRANQVEHATRNNGDLKIYFFNEKEVKENPYVILTGNWKSNLYNNDFNPYNQINDGSFNTNITYKDSVNTFSSDTSGMDDSLTGSLNSLNGTRITSTACLDSLGMMSLDIDNNDNQLKDNSLKSKKRMKKSVDEQMDARSFFSQNSLGDVEVKLDELIGNKVEDTTETGRIGQGSKSGQRFETVDLDFEQFTFHSIEYKLYPISEKPIESADLRQYCSQCGKKLKKTDMYCASCGKKAD